MIRHCERHEKAQRMSDHEICPRILAKLDVIEEASTECIATRGGDGEFEVIQGRATLTVNLRTRECLCGRWQLTGIPCKHAYRCIVSCGQDPASYCHQYFSGKKYKKCYAKILHPVPSQEYWPAEHEYPTIEHPELKRGVGRPARNRRREEGEQQRHKRNVTLKCALCHEPGHNKRSCQGGLTNAQRRARDQEQRHRAAADQGTNTIPALSTEGASTSQPTTSSQPALEDAAA